MSSRNYWSYVLGGNSWQELLVPEIPVAGFPRRSRNLQTMGPGDYLLCYQRLEGKIGSCWVGALEVTSRVEEGHTPIWRDGEYPWRVGVKVVVALTPETGISIHLLRDQLTLQWPGFFRNYPNTISEADGEIIVNALQAADGFGQN